jgi:hypothetical protein
MAQFKLFILKESTEFPKFQPHTFIRTLGYASYFNNFWLAYVYYQEILANKMKY